MSDTGPRLRVPHEQASHGRDLAQVGGHTILVILHSNQCVALFDAMPTDIEFLHGVWLVITFDFTQIWMDFKFMHLTNLTICCNGQGIDHPDSIPDTR